MTSPSQDRRAFSAAPIMIPPRTVSGASPVLFAAGLAVILLVNSGTVAGLLQQWWSYQNHGFALTALIGWVCWRDRSSLFLNPVPWWPAAGAVAGCSVIWFVGSSAGIQVVEQISTLVVIVAWSLGVLGRSKIRPILRLGGYALLAMPVWGLLIGTLQQLTILANAFLLLFTGLKADISGTYIAIPEGTFEVAGSCAGQAFLMSGLTVAVAYWEMSPALSARGRWIALALMTTLSLVSNWIRVFLLIMIGHWTNMQSPLIADHGWFGWLIFAGMVGVFLYATRFIERRYSLDAPPLQDRSEPLGSGNIASKPAYTSTISLPVAIAVLTALAIAGPTSGYLLAQIPRDPSPASPVSVVRLPASSSWDSLAIVERQPLVYGDSADVKPWGPRYAGADRHQTSYWRKGDDSVQVDRLIFSGRDHRHKLFADGNAMAKRRAVLVDRIVGIPVGTQVRSFRQAVVRVDTSEVRAILYWYVVGESATGTAISGRLRQAWATIARSAPSELVAVSARCDTNCETAFTLLSEFVLGSGGGDNNAGSMPGTR